MELICLFTEEMSLKSATDFIRVCAKVILYLYKTFLAKNQEDFKKEKFINILKHLGKGAFCCKKQEKRTKVLAQVGEEAFNLGILIVNEDTRMLSSKTEDIFLTFPNIGVRHFLSAFFVLCSPSEPSVPPGLEWNHIEPIIPYCIWLRSSECLPDFSVASDRADKNLSLLSSRLINQTYLYFCTVDYPSLGIYIENFYRELFATCKQAHTSIISHSDSVKIARKMHSELSGIESCMFTSDIDEKENNFCTTDFEVMERSVILEHKYESFQVTEMALTCSEHHRRTLEENRILPKELVIYWKGNYRTYEANEDQIQPTIARSDTRMKTALRDEMVRIEARLYFVS